MGLSCHHTRPKISRLVADFISWLYKMISQIKSTSLGHLLAAQVVVSNDANEAGLWAPNGTGVLESGQRPRCTFEVRRITCTNGIGLLLGTKAYNAACDPLSHGELPLVAAMLLAFLHCWGRADDQQTQMLPEDANTARRRANASMGTRPPNAQC